MPGLHRAATVAVVLLAFTPWGSFSQTHEDSASEAAGIAIDGPPPHTPPETITPDASGRATVRAIHLKEPLVLDGSLDESVYSTVAPFGGLIRVAPNAGEPSTERSDVWVMYDEENMYVTCRCWDSAPPEQWVVNELRRDTSGLRQNDHFVLGPGGTASPT